MKRAVLLLALLALVSAPALAQATMPNAEQLEVLEAHFQYGRTLAQLQATQSNMKNISTAIQMFHMDRGKVPGRLQELSPEYLKSVLPCIVDNRPFRYQARGQSSYVLSTEGQPFAVLGLPAGYPKLEGTANGDPVLHVKPNQVAPSRYVRTRGAERYSQGLQAMATFHYVEGVKAYREALAAGDLDPLTEAHLRKFLKDWQRVKGPGL